MLPDALAKLNALSHAEAVAAFSRCCGAHRWAEAMAAARPFAGEESLFAAAELVADGLEREDWLEAFTHHPMIGDIESLRKKFATTRDWSAQEQAGAAAAQEEVLHALKRQNEAYLAKFGHIFIVCATGKTAAEMLAILEGRIGNDAAAELANAAAEQRKITRIRLEKLELT